METLDVFKLKHDVIRVDSSGDWQKNTSMKPLVIKRSQGKVSRPMPIIYNDVDAVIL